MRKRMITRTIKQTIAKVMCVDVTTADVTINTYAIGGTYTDAELLAKLATIYETDTFKLIHIESQTVNVVKLGMSEDDFIRYAEVLEN